MDFSEMKMIWDSQNQEPLYAMNEAALHAVVQRRSEEWDRCLARCFVMEITLGLACGLLMLVCAGALAFGHQAWLATFSWVKVTILPWDSLALFVAGAIWFYYSAYMYLARRRQLQREELFESTLRGAIERALAQTEFQVTTARNIVWWGLLPVWVASTLWVLTLLHLGAKPAWTYPFMAIFIIASLVVVILGKRRSVTNRFQPRQAELEALRAKLADPQR